MKASVKGRKKVSADLMHQTLSAQQGEKLP